MAKSPIEPSVMRASILGEIRGYPPHDERRRACASNHRLRTYPDVCDKHGETPHKTASGDCTACTDGPRKIARRAGRPQYGDNCPQHGFTSFSTLHGKCLTCFTSSGMVRGGPAPVSARAAARREGRTYFLARCEPCGAQTRHHVQRGKCLTCFTALGAVRKATSYADALQSPRTLAKRDGHATYLTRCTHHGVTLHDTETGECLTCWALDAAMTAP